MSHFHWSMLNEYIKELCWNKSTSSNLHGVKSLFFFITINRILIYQAPMCKNISFFYSILMCNCRYTLCVTPANRGSPWRVPPWAVFVCVSYIYGNYETTYRSSSMWLSRATERLWYLLDLCKRNYPSTLYSSSTIYENYADFFFF